MDTIIIAIIIVIVILFCIKFYFDYKKYRSEIRKLDEWEKENKLNN